MPPPSKIDQLSEEVRRELEERIIAAGFGDYVEHARWLREEKGQQIGKSTVGAYGQKLERRLAAIKTSTEAAKLIVQAAPDDADDLGSSVIRMIQHEAFESMIALQDAADEADPAKRIDILGKAAKNFATLTRASVARNKWAVELRDKALLDAANRVESAALERGLTGEDAKFWREQVLMGM